MSAAFGTTDDRKLDTTAPGIMKNPGPGAYLADRTETSADRIP